MEVVLLTVNPSTYVKHPAFRISEWLVTFSFVISLYFIVSFEEVEETVTQK